MGEQKDKQQHEDARSLDMENNTEIHQVDQVVNKEKPQEEDTSKEIIATHDDSGQEEGVDEQYGGDAADNRDDLEGEGDSSI